MAEYYQSMETLSPENRPTLDLFMAKMVESEIQYRNRKRTEMYLRTSRLRYNTVMEDVICSEERNLTKQTLQELADCDFIPQAQNLLITGRTGMPLRSSCGVLLHESLYREDLYGKSRWNATQGH